MSVRLDAGTLLLRIPLSVPLTLSGATRLRDEPFPFLPLLTFALLLRLEFGLAPFERECCTLGFCEEDGLVGWEVAIDVSRREYGQGLLHGKEDEACVDRGV